MLTTFKECRDAGQFLEAARSGRSKTTEEQFWEITLTEMSNLTPSQVKRINFGWLFESFVPDGREFMNEIRGRAGVSGYIRETIGPTGIEGFRMIAGQLLFDTFKKGYENPAFIADDLFETVPAQTMFQMLIPGLTNIGSSAVESLRDDQEYPLVTMGEDWILAPELERKGCRIELTEDMLNELSSFQVLEQAQKVGTALGIEREKTLLNCALVGTGKYARKSTTFADVYQTSTPYINRFDNTMSAALANAAIDAAELKLQGMTDPNTGDPIAVGNGRQIVFPIALRNAVFGYLASTGYQWGDTTQATTMVVTSTRKGTEVTGMAHGVDMPTPHSNAFVSTVQTAASVEANTWYYGDFKNAVKYREMYPIQVIPMPSGYDATWTRNVIAGYVARRFGSPYWEEPRLVIQNNPA